MNLGISVSVSRTAVVTVDSHGVEGAYSRSSTDNLETTEGIVKVIGDRERIPFVGGWAEFDGDHDSFVQVGDRAVPQRIDALFEGTADKGPTAHMTIEMRRGAPHCTELTIRAHPEGREVRGADLRAFRLEGAVNDVAALASVDVVTADDGSTVFSRSLNRALQAAAPGEVVNATFSEWLRMNADEGGEQEFAQASKTIKEARSGSRRRLTDELLKQVAEIYRANLNDRPGEAVQAAYWVCPRQAARYIRAARDKGFLPPTTQGKVTG